MVGVDNNYNGCRYKNTYDKVTFVDKSRIIVYNLVVFVKNKKYYDQTYVS